MSAVTALLPSSWLGAGDAARESAVLAVAVRQQVDEHLDATARARNTVVGVGINPGE